MPVRATSPVRSSDRKTFDFNIGYDLSGLGGFFNDARVNFTAVNFTDADPPFFDSGTTAVVDTLPDPYDPANATALGRTLVLRSEEHTSELQSLMRISYAVFCLKKKKNKK